MKRRLGVAIFTVLFLGVMFGGLFNMSLGMSMTGDMSGCPFMEHGEMLCSMSVFDHFAAWESTFMAVVPAMVWLMAAASLLAIINIAPNLLLRTRYLILKQSGYVRERTYTFIYKFWQELFARGILNPKLF